VSMWVVTRSGVGDGIEGGTGITRKRHWRRQLEAVLRADAGGGIGGGNCGWYWGRY
jgi:hypothetical protein